MSCWSDFLFALGLQVLLKSAVDKGFNTFVTQIVVKWVSARKSERVSLIMAKQSLSLMQVVFCLCAQFLNERIAYIKNKV